MKTNNTHVVCTFIAILTTFSWVKGAPLPVSNPFAAPSTQNPSTSIEANPSPGMPSLPTTTATSTATNTTAEGLNGNLLSVWRQDYLTGDWGGFRDTMLNQGVAISPVWIGEVFGNPSGGMRRGLISDGLFNVALDLNLDRMSDSPIFDDTLIHANADYIYGTSLSGSYVGDFSNTSNLAAYNTIRLQELWIQRAFWEKRISLKIGNMAVDNEFFQSSSAALFINGTFGAFTFIGSNVPNAPVYPVASPGVRIQFLPTSKFYVMAGVYGMDNNSDPAVNNKYGTRFALDGGSGMLVMSEAGYLLNQSPNDRGLQGTYRVGSFTHTANYTTWQSQANFANGTGPLQSAGANYGIYGVLDQEIFKNGEQTVSLFVRSGGAPSNTNFVDYYVDGGFNFSGFIPSRLYDTAGLAIARSHVSSQYSDSQVAQGSLPSTAETVLEATYKVQIAPWWSVQPDFQYIVNPSGVQGSKNATVLGLRSSVAF